MIGVDPDGPLSWASKGAKELESKDFFRTRAQTPLRERFLMTGMTCQVSTNSDRILAWARKIWVHLPASTGADELDLCFWVGPDSILSTPPWPKPYFRGWGRFVFAGFDGFNSFVVDLSQRRIVGRFTPTFVEDEAVWKKIVFPVIPGVLASSLEIPVLHSACVEREGRGLMLAGPSGAGKSTLTLALSQAGFGYLADDRTYLSLRKDRLCAWGVGGFLKLRSDSSRHFSGIAGRTSSLDCKGETVFELHPEDDLGLKVAKCCEPHCLVFLERTRVPESRLERMEPSDVVFRLEQLVSEEPGGDSGFHGEVIRRLSKLPSYVLYNEGPLQETVNLLADLLNDSPALTKPRLLARDSTMVLGKAVKEDPLRRETLLNCTMKVSVLGRTGKLETNSAAILDSFHTLFSRQAVSINSSLRFNWRIVSDQDGVMSPPWPLLTAFSSNGLRFVNIGQRSFVAVHLGTGEAVGFVPETLVKDEPGFAGVFLATLLHLTMPVLGLTAFQAGCLSRNGKGLLLLGPPRSGKSCCAYAARKLGLEFHSDMATFLELGEGKLRAWGEFWPALFREEAVLLFPELRNFGRRLEHQSETFLSLDKTLFGGCFSHSVTPVLAVVLERGSAKTPGVTQLASREYYDALQASLSLEEEPLYQVQQEKLLSKLCEIPAYRLAYGNDPADAAMLCDNLLTAHDTPKAAL